MSDKKYVDGFRFFERRSNQPEFVLGAIILTPSDLLGWAEENPDAVSEYQDKKQIRLQLKKSKDGKIYADLDTYKKDPKDDIPF